MAAAHLFLSRITPPSLEALLVRACEGAARDKEPLRTTAHVHFIALVLSEKKALGLVEPEARALLLLLAGQVDQMENIFSSCVLPEWEDTVDASSAS
ncbi:MULTISPECIES: hypothetical protein [unclassified Variovorax]|uniref:hypothetical protein n=1 Tax=unclassified Variovorax TaxID=663243 RepID=UPI0011AFC9E5|nr:MULTISPECIES: hypothetical protein [unclassified Variovorax]